ncbi:MAG: hypothetical protein J6V44_09140 [Methanobrevibacter sp.]|nr:hypothetical protein [Methanobrevibacter sp.]
MGNIIIENYPEQKQFFYAETYNHMMSVSKKMAVIINKLIKTSTRHDASKVESKIESDLFIAMTPKLKSSTYGSEEYKKFLEELKPALDNHYKENRHHPEHFENGIKGMTLVDLIEMLCDWCAAVERHSDGNILKSIEINQKRFGYSDELKQILINTLEQELPECLPISCRENNNDTCRS